MNRKKWSALAVALLLTVTMATACEGKVGPQGEQGIQGIQGEKGDKGDKGDPGAQGAQGIQGEKGDKGDTGAQGAQGIQGEKGDKGDTGAQGEQGIQGEKGDKGDTGAQGAQGIQGEKGDKGDPGAQGEQGIQGETGVQGESGAPGDAGQSAYEIYLKYHPTYTGTEEEWIADYVNGTLTRHTVTFDLNGGIAAEGFEASVEAHYGKPIALTMPTREGYTFIGWYTGESINDGMFTTTDTVTADLSLIAMWRINRVTVKFLDHNGGIAKTQEVDWGTAATPPELPASFGAYFFQGWSADTSNVTADMTVEAVYTQKTYTVTYHVSGTESTETVYYASIPAKPADPVVEGLVFGGWYADSEYTIPYAFDTAANADIHVYAMLSEYTVISTADELRSISANPNAKYRLANDIDLNGNVWTPIATFGGILDGQGHKIYNFILSGSGVELGFINNNKGTVENLILSDFVFTSSTSSTFTAGVLAARNNGTIQNCNIQEGKVSFVYSHAGNNSSSSKTYISYGGGLVGHNTGILLQNKVDIDILCAVSGSSKYSDVNMYLDTGALVGNNTGRIEQCFAQATLDYSANAAVPTASGRQETVGNVFGGAVCINSGDIRDSSCQITATCQAGGNGKMIAEFGGFVMDNTGTVTGCSAKGTIVDELGYITTTRFGGFVCKNGGVISNCYADTMQKCKGVGYGTSRNSGFVFWNTKTISNCYATGSIESAVSSGVASFAGHNFATGIISKCFSSCALNATSASAVTGSFIATSETGSSIFKCYYDKDQPILSGDTAVEPTNQEGTAASLSDFYGSALVVDTLGFTTDIWHITDNALPILQWQNTAA